MEKDESYGLFMHNLELLDDFEQFAAMMRSRGEAIDECAVTGGLAASPNYQCRLINASGIPTRVDCTSCPRSSRSLVDDLTDMQFF